MRMKVTRPKYGKLPRDKTGVMDAEVEWSWRPYSWSPSETGMARRFMDGDVLIWKSVRDGWVLKFTRREWARLVEGLKERPRKRKA